MDCLMDHEFKKSVIMVMVVVKVSLIFFQKEMMRLLACSDIVNKNG